MEEEYHKKAVAQIGEGNLEKALDFISKALETAPYDPVYLTERGTIYLQLNMKEPCLKDMDSVVNLDPKNGYRYSCRAYAKSWFKDIDGAIKDYETAVELDREDAIAYNNLGLLLERKGAIEKAKRNFKRADDLSKEKEEYKDFFDTRTEEQKEAREENFRKEAKEEVNPIYIEETRSKKEIAKDVFRKKSTFKEFVRFVMNGFKIKENDEKGES
jgi:Tfp pilus assembly protein PilF